jgi:SAM-dependent methyltransferase
VKYFKLNKEAWEEAFDKHQNGYKNKPISEGLNSKWAYINNDLKKELGTIGINNKNIAQFCCNNGREILSIIQSGAKSGTGFDIAENFIEEAKRIVKEKNINCSFICTNILDINEKFKENFDLVFSTIGSICWFNNLNDFFNKVNLVLKPNGIFILNENHPITNIFAMESEEKFDKNQPEKIVYPYFKNDPWVETNGMDYVGNTQYKSKTFTSFSHTFSDIINSMSNNNIKVVKINEYNHSLYEFDLLNNGKIPLSMIIVGKKK